MQKRWQFFTQRGNGGRSVGKGGGGGGGGIDVLLEIHDSNTMPRSTKIFLLMFALTSPSHQSQFKHVQRPATSLVGGREEVGTAKQQAQLIHF